MITVMSSSLLGSVPMPPSKSHAQRVLAAALLAEGSSLIASPGNAHDVLTAIGLLTQSAQNVVVDNEKVEITGGMKILPNSVFNCNDSALCARLFTPVFTLSGKSFVVTGSSGLRKRPVAKDLLNLTHMGLRVESNGDFLPLKIVGGTLRAGYYCIDASQSSQFASGLLMSLACTDADSSIELIHALSMPYLILTVKVMRDFGIEVFQQGNVFDIRGKQRYRAGEFNIEGDWSAAAFWCVAAAIAGKIVLKNLNFDSVQADIAVLQLLQQAEVQYSVLADGLHVEKSNVRAFEFDVSHCPDLFPAAAVLACVARGESQITGVQRLSHKESHRPMVIHQAFAKLGVPCSFRGDEFRITGTEIAGNTILGTDNDHRMAMAFTVLALATTNGLMIDNSKCVAKSYPDFYKHFLQLGGNVHE